MDEIFCNSCGNFHKMTSEFTFCLSCNKLVYKNSRNEFPFVSPKAIGFLALYETNSKLVKLGLGLTSMDAIEEYFFQKSDYFPHHVYSLNSLQIRQNYFDWLVESSLPNSVPPSKIQDGLACALSEIKYILYGADGVKEQLDPLKAGKYAGDFTSAANLATRKLAYFYTRGLNHFCDSCLVLGVKDKMLRSGVIHPYDGCIWCI